MEVVFHDGSGLFQQDNVPSHKVKMVQEWFKEQEVQGFDLASRFPRFQSNGASVGRAGLTT